MPLLSGTAIATTTLPVCGTNMNGALSIGVVLGAIVGGVVTGAACAAVGGLLLSPHSISGDAVKHAAIGGAVFFLAEALIGLSLVSSLQNAINTAAGSPVVTQ